MTLDGSLLLLVHPHERLLHRVACAVEVLQDALGVLQERTLKPLKSGLNPRCLLFALEENIGGNGQSYTSPQGLSDLFFASEQSSHSAAAPRPQIFRAVCLTP